MPRDTVSVDWSLANWSIDRPSCMRTTSTGGIVLNLAEEGYDALRWVYDTVLLLRSEILVGADRFSTAAAGASTRIGFLRADSSMSACGSRHGVEGQMPPSAERSQSGEFYHACGGARLGRRETSVKSPVWNCSPVFLWKFRFLESGLVLRCVVSTYKWIGSKLSRA